MGAIPPLFQVMKLKIKTHYLYTFETEFEFTTLITKSLLFPLLTIFSWVLFVVEMS